MPFIWTLQGCYKYGKRMFFCVVQILYICVKGLSKGHLQGFLKKCYRAGGVRVASQITSVGHSYFLLWPSWIGGLMAWRHILGTSVTHNLNKQEPICQPGPGRVCKRIWWQCYRACRNFYIIFFNFLCNC